MHRTRRLALAALAVAALATGGCTAGSSGAASPGGFLPGMPGSTTGSGSGSPSGRVASGSVSPSRGASGTGSPTSSQAPAAARLPLTGKVIGIDPGHDEGNFSDPSYINRLVWNGREYETCDTTGTETAGGYTEARFNFNVASYLRADLIADGARVVMTRNNNTGVGPCVTTRAQIINDAHADVGIDIHADGGPVWGRGFTVLDPVADGPNDKVIQASIRFGSDVRDAMLKYTAMPESNYDGVGGVVVRDDLAGLNLTTVPKILIECGNMPNATDASMLTSESFQREVARALTAAILAFLTGRPA